MYRVISFFQDSDYMRVHLSYVFNYILCLHYILLIPKLKSGLLTCKMWLRRKCFNVVNRVDFIASKIVTPNIFLIV